MGSAVSAADREADSRPDGLVAFAIPPQPLPQALDAFSAATGIEVLVDARNAEGRLSIGVTGVMTPREALSILLTGAPLIVQEFSPGTVTLMKGGEGTSPRSEPALTAAAEPPYYVTIQRALFRALCRNQATPPGSYRLALKLRIGPSGTVSRWKLLGTTGDAQRDKALGAVLSGLDIGEPPPADLAQPVAVLILPRAAQGGDCSQGGRDQ
jgi:hypothetical protein